MLQNVSREPQRLKAQVVCCRVGVECCLAEQLRSVEETGADLQSSGMQEEDQLAFAEVRNQNKMNPGLCTPHPAHGRNLSHEAIFSNSKTDLSSTPAAVPACHVLARVPGVEELAGYARLFTCSRTDAPPQPASGFLPAYIVRGVELASEHRRQRMTQSCTMEGKGLVAELQRAAICPACRGHFKDPVILDCDHSYCRACITRYWDEETAKGNRVLSCPLCKKVFERRNLRTNVKLAVEVKITQHLNAKTAQVPLAPKSKHRRGGWRPTTSIQKEKVGHG